MKQTAAITSFSSDVEKKQYRKWPWFALSLVVIIVDQATKYWAIATLLPYQPESLMPMLNFTLAYNTGAAFSFLNNAGAWHYWFFVCFSLAMSILLLVWMVRMTSSARLPLCAISLLLGGAVGNLVDRIVNGHVTDFIDVYYKTYHWPVFNVADSAICLGAVLLLFWTVDKQ